MTLDQLRVDESAAGMRLDLFLARQFMAGSTPRLGLRPGGSQRSNPMLKATTIGLGGAASLTLGAALSLPLLPGVPDRE